MFRSQTWVDPAIRERVRGTSLLSRRLAVLTAERDQRSDIVVGGRYTLRCSLGQGGQARVFLASSSDSEDLGVIKIQRGREHNSVRRFLRETSVLRRMDHPMIPRLLDCGREGDRLFLVTPFHRARSLEAVMRERLGTAPLKSTASAPGDHSLAGERGPGGFSINEVLRIVSGVAEALVYAHRMGIFHRDVKPANILLRPRCRPILVDFGLAALEGHTAVTGPGDVVGTLRYMSPEHLDPSARKDARTDAYQLALIAYELLTGDLPIPTPNDPAQWISRYRAPIPSAALSNPGAPVDLEIALQQALSPHPEDRPAGVEPILAVVRACLAARAGTTTIYPFGDTPARLGEFAWHVENSKDRPHPVGGKRPNAYGLHDMLGNVWEWCEDSYHDTYEGAPVDGSAWTTGGDPTRHITRGGSFDINTPAACRPAVRGSPMVVQVAPDCGFRVVCDAELGPAVGDTADRDPSLAP